MTPSELRALPDKQLLLLVCQAHARVWNVYDSRDELTAMEDEILRRMAEQQEGR